MSRTSLGIRKQMNVRMSPELINQIDTARGPISRDRWIENAARLALKPIAAGRDPELRQKIHQHRYTDRVSTSFAHGNKYVTMRCECGQETEVQA